MNMSFELFNVKVTFKIEKNDTLTKIIQETKTYLGNDETNQLVPVIKSLRIVSMNHPEWFTRLGYTLIKHGDGRWILSLSDAKNIYDKEFTK